MRASPLRTDVRHRRACQTEYELEEQHRRRTHLLGLSTLVAGVLLVAAVLHHVLTTYTTT